MQAKCILNIPITLGIDSFNEEELQAVFDAALERVILFFILKDLNFHVFLNIEKRH